MKACPFYTARLSLHLAEVVVLPYNILLHRAMREASGIQLEGNIVLIDEAHNLLETINAVYSVVITGAQLTKAHNQLSQYEQRYQVSFSLSLSLSLSCFSSCPLLLFLLLSLSLVLSLVLSLFQRLAIFQEYPGSLKVIFYFFFFFISFEPYVCIYIVT